MRTFKIFTLITMLCVHFAVNLSGQIIIDNSIQSGYDITFNDTVLTCMDNNGSCSSHTYYFDLDGDETKDILFQITCRIGSYQRSYYMSTKTFNNFSVHYNPDYEEHFQYYDEVNEQIIDTSRIVNVVKRYQWGETIDNNCPVTSEYIPIYNYFDDANLGIVMHNIVHFSEDTSYIAYSKVLSNDTVIFYLKVTMHDKTDLRIMSEKTSNPHLQVEEIYSSTIQLYPNPSSEFIYFTRGKYSIEIYNILGNLIKTEKIPESQNKLDISWMKNGYYFIKFRYDGKETVTRFIKI